MFFKRAVQRYAHRFLGVAQGILDNDLVFALAQDDADTRRVVGVAKLRIDRREVEIHLAGKFRSEVLDFQFDDDEATQPQMIEKQVEIIILAAHLKMVLAADEGEALAQLEDQRAQMVDQPLFELPFRYLGAERKKVEDVGVFDQLLSKVRLGRGSVRAKLVSALPCRCNRPVSI